jgi:hypothetical protein
MNDWTKEQRESIARWMVDHGFATGHGDTVEDLLKELEWQIQELHDQLWSYRKGKAER